MHAIEQARHVLQCFCHFRTPKSIKKSPEIDRNLSKITQIDRKAPKITQERLRSTQERQKSVQERPRWLQDRPKSRQKAAQEAKMKKVHPMIASTRRGRRSAGAAGEGKEGEPFPAWLDTSSLTRQYPGGVRRIYWLRRHSTDRCGVPNRLLGGPKSTLRGLKMEPGSSRSAWERPRTSPERPKSRPKRPKSAPRASKIAPRASKRRPKGAQETPRGAEEAPKRTQEVPKGSQNSPQRVQNRS